MQDFKNIVVWQRAHKLTVKIYKVTTQYPSSELYALVSQMRRSAQSIPTNIAEGTGRKTKADFSHFLQMALGSASELEYQLLLSRDLDYINNEIYIELDKEIKEIRKMLTVFIQRVESGTPKN